MKKLIFLPFLLFLFFSCQEDEATILPAPATVYRLAAVYSDPGDGSGDFESVDSQREITFLDDTTISVNAPICDMGINTGSTTIVTLNLNEQTINDDCEGWRNLSFEKTDLELIISYPCIEPCLHKYVRE